ncbi:MAG: DNA/RNA helicase domain-containing protein, partial [Actinomycetota bacterium]
MLAYVATKQQFLADAPTIEDKVEAAVKAKLGIRVSPAEKTAWRNSLGNAMSHLARDSRIPDDAGVAIEYRLNGRRFRIDFMLSGKNPAGKESLVIVELKQWSEIKASELRDHVRTFVGGAVRDEHHPSYQAWSYSSHMQSYNEYVYSNGVSVAACAYLHNCDDPTIIKDEAFTEWTSSTPVFIKGELEPLVQHVTQAVATGGGVDLLTRIDKSPIRPSKPLADAVGNMLNGQTEFVLIDEQKTVLENIVAAATKAQVDTKQVLIIHGGPGTGKSVIALNALARLTSLRKNVRYVTPNAAPRAVFEDKLQKILNRQMLTGLFSGSGAYTTSPKDAFDMLIVDEAHRLKARHQYSKGGVNQINEIIAASRASVFFIDEAQQVTWKDIGDISAIEEFAKVAGAEIHHFTLHSQFRCGGSDDYLVWLDDTLGIRSDDSSYFSPDRYDFRIFDNPVELHDTIREKNRDSNKSRMVAGYCWNWVSRNDKTQADLAFPEFRYQANWNLTEHGSKWIIEPDSVSEVGCIHTCQGLELDYVGVIIGPDLVFRDGELTTEPAARAKSDKSLAGYKKTLKKDPVA